MPGEPVFFTGARGFLGGRLTRAIPGAIPLDADVTDRAALARAFAAARPPFAVVHLAAANELVCGRDLARGFAVNCVGTHNLLEAAASAGVRRVIFFSTIHVYGPPQDDAPLSERSVPAPVHPYGITKLAAEHLCAAARRQHGFDLAIVRLSNGVGAPADEHITRWSLVALDLCRQAHEEHRLTLQSSGVQRRDFIGIRDIVAAVSLLLRVESHALEPLVFNLGSGEAIQIREMANLVRSEYQNLYGEMLPLAAAPVAGAIPGRFRYDLSRMRALGFEPRTDLHEEIREILQFCARFRR